MTRVVLVNPPAPRPTMRDYYCSSSSKAGYVWPPIDLLLQGAWLKERHLLLWRDFAVTPLPPARAAALLEQDRPEAIFGLVGAAAPNDLAFWREVRERTGARLFLSGDLVRFDPARFLAERDFVEGAATDFTAPGLRDLLAGRAATPGLARRNVPPPVASGPFAHPLPPHELAWALPYRHPFLPAGFATVMTDHGCPHRCRYCNSGVVGWRPRDLANLAAELAWLTARGRTALFVKDMTFNADARHTAAVLDLFGRTGIRRFICYLRPDRVTPEQARDLAAAGCVMAMAGVESGSDRILKGFRPGATAAATEQGIRLLHNAGVPVGGHFILGFPGETPAELAATVALARRLPLAYASFNLAAPRPGTPLDRPASGSVAGLGAKTADGSAATTRLLADGLSRETLLAWRRSAVRSFYLRPGYLWRTARRALAGGLLWRQIRHGWALLAMYGKAQGEKR